MSSVEPSDSNTDLRFTKDWTMDDGEISKLAKMLETASREFDDILNPDNLEYFDYERLIILRDEFSELSKRLKKLDYECYSWANQKAREQIDNVIKKSYDEC